MTKRKKLVWVEWDDYHDAKIIAAEEDIKISDVFKEGLKELKIKTKRVEKKFDWKI